MGRPGQEDTSIASFLNLNKCDDFHTGGALLERGVIDVSSPEGLFGLLKDLSSLANSAGGTAVYGVHAGNVEGLDVGDPGTFSSKLSSHLAVRLAPGLPEDTYSVKLIPAPKGRHVLVMQVSRSALGPHAILGEGGSLLFLKWNKGIETMGLEEVKGALMRHTTMNDITSYLGSKAEELLQGNAPVPLIGSGKLMVCIIPRENLKPKKAVTLEKAADRFANIEWCEEWVRTVDANLGYASDLSYVLVGDDGHLEAVDAFKMKPKTDGRKAVDIVSFQNEIANLIEAYVAYFDDSDTMSGDHYISIALVGVRGYEMNLRMPGKKKLFDEDLVLMPPIQFSPAAIIDRQDAVHLANAGIDILWGMSGY